VTYTGEGLARLAAVMDRLRSPGGCPWDAEQTHESLVQYLVEETFEAVDAIDSGDRTDLLEELGDLLLQVFFHARIAQEHPDSPFDIDDVANGIADKLVRRHPHVFPGADGELLPAADASDVEARWQSLKAAEKERSSVTDGVPHSMPALTQVAKLLTRLANAGQSAPLEPAAAAAVAELAASGHDLGEVVIAAIAQQRSAGLDPDAVLRERVRGLRTRITAAERAARNG
jgi:XTP/dITP diphosphohydrolase